MNIFEKMMRISSEVNDLSKDLSVEMSNGKNYSAISEKSVLDAIKPLESKYRVFSYPVKRTRSSQVMRREWKDANGQMRATTLLVDRVDVTYRFVNVDTPTEYIEVDSFGTGIDTGDKGPGKAMTYADKYALMKAYKLSGGNASDPDTIGSPAEWDVGASVESPAYMENAGQVWMPPGVGQSVLQDKDFQRNVPSPVDSMAQTQDEYKESLDSLVAPPMPGADQQSFPMVEQKPDICNPPAQQAPSAPAITLEEARALVVPIGTEKGKSLGELLVMNRSLVEFYAGDKFKNSKYPKLKAAARRLLEVE